MRPYVQKQVALLSPYLTGIRSLLDFGCGDLSLAIGLKSVLINATITGVDVVDSGVRDPGIKFRLYEGQRLPFADRSFDATVVYHVLHHCTDPRKSLTDVMRVTKQTILMVEPVYRSALDLFFMKILDRIGNGWRSAAIPMPYMFQKEDTWRMWVHSLGWRVQSTIDAGVLPAWLPFGATKLFVLTRLPSGRKR